jgi:uncharacterized protein (TIGR04255 family)
MLELFLGHHGMVRPGPPSSTSLTAHSRSRYRRPRCDAKECESVLASCRGAMTTTRTLKQPPITEALVDLRAAPKKPLDEAVLKSELSDQFPKVTRRNVFDMKVERRTNALPLVEGRDGGLRGFFFESADGREIAQFRVDGFTYNRLPPYEGGERLIERALELWEIYVRVADPDTVTRVALRYINHIRLPRQGDFGDYLTAPPSVPDAIDGALESFLGRITIRGNKSERHQIILTQSAEPGPDRAHVNLLIDVDASERTAGALGTAREDVLPALMTLRQLKNDAFFGAVTDKTLELCS